jgi:deoxyribose-phosphate aldolase
MALNNDCNEYTPPAVAGYIDHTILKPDASKDEVLKVCEEAKTYRFASVCVNPAYIGLVTKALRGSGVKPCAVVGFPLGALTPEMKAAETLAVIASGAKKRIWW